MKQTAWFVAPAFVLLALRRGAGLAGRGVIIVRSAARRALPCSLNRLRERIAPAMSFVSRGFRGRPHARAEGDRLPPGQYLVRDFPVLSVGPTPRPRLADWTFSINGEVDDVRRWTWEELRALPSETITRDIHCVTKWSKFDTVWEGVSVDTLLEGLDSAADHVMAFCDGGYTTNIPLEDITGGKAWVAFSYDGQALEAEHGGPARLLVPHLYFWKSAKWVRGLTLMNDDSPGFWEVNGYHMYGDPWLEQRYSGD